jgi:hypothetical protein
MTPDSRSDDLYDDAKCFVTVVLAAIVIGSLMLHQVHESFPSHNVEYCLFR